MNYTPGSSLSTIPTAGDLDAKRYEFFHSAIDSFLFQVRTVMQNAIATHPKRDVKAWWITIRQHQVTEEFVEAVEQHLLLQGWAMYQFKQYVKDGEDLVEIKFVDASIYDPKIHFDEPEDMEPKRNSGLV